MSSYGRLCVLGYSQYCRSSSSSSSGTSPAVDALVASALQSPGGPASPPETAFEPSGSLSRVIDLRPFDEPNGLREVGNAQLRMLVSPDVARSMRSGRACRAQRAASEESTADATHSFSLRLQSDVAAVIRFEREETMDMFQFGRGSAPDCAEFALNSSTSGAEEAYQNYAQLGGLLLRHGPLMSRYAFRLQVERQAPHRAFVFAGGFDKENHFFLGDSALCWTRPAYDGFVTNGVRILQLVPTFGDKGEVSEDPAGTVSSFSSDEDNPAMLARRAAAAWREVSARGSLYGLRPRHRTVGRRDEKRTNCLGEVSLISAGGLNLLWVSARYEARLSRSIGLRQIDRALNSCKPICPVSFFAIRINFSGEATADDLTTSTDALPVAPWVFPACGHVHGPLVDPRATSSCPLCRRKGGFVPLRVPTETALRLTSVTLPIGPNPEPEVASDDDLSIEDMYVLNPCGHLILKQRVAELWAHVLRVPALEESIYDAPHMCFCPFCRCSLAKPAFSKIHVESLGSLSVDVPVGSAPARMTLSSELKLNASPEERAGTFYGALQLS